MTDRLRQSFHRLRSLFRSAEQDRELDAEVSHHLDLAIEENLRRGLSPQEARRQALIRFGGSQQAKENHRDARGLPVAWIETMKQAMRTAGERFTARRMVQEYCHDYYIPASSGVQPDDDPPTA